MGTQINFSSICRACLANGTTSSLSLHSIYNSSGLEDDEDDDDPDSFSNIAKMMIAISSTNLHPNDKLPDKICSDCLILLKKAYRFQRMCQESYEKLKSFEIIQSSQKNNKMMCTSITKDLKCELIDCLDKNSNDTQKIQLSEQEEKSSFQNEIGISNEQKDESRRFENSLRKLEEPCENNKIPGDHKCTICEETFTEELNLQNHIKDLHGNEEKRFECNVCKELFIQENCFHQHRSTAHCNSLSSIRKFKCPISECNREFDKLKSLNLHVRFHKNVKRHKNKFNCPNCDEIFPSTILLKKHQKSHHKIKCELCTKTFKSDGELIEHINRHSGLKPYTCNICNKSFQQSCTLKDHLRTHSGEQPFLCSQCGKKFNNASNLRQHIIRHTGIKPFECTECPSRFTSKGGLKSHMVTHSKIKPFICDICGSTFTKPYSLAKHKRIHTGEKPYACEVCDMRFNSSHHVKRHMRTHTGEKPYKCEFCKRAFAQSNDLIKHKRSHIGDYIYKCYECPMAFRLHSELKEHIREHFIQKKLSNNNENNTNLNCNTVEVNNYSKENDIENDRNNLEESQNTETTICRCRNCSLESKLLIDLQNHNCVSNSNENSLMKNEENTICEEKNSIFHNNSSQSPTKLILLKTENDQFQCPECFMLFRNVSDIVAHMNVVHCKSEALSWNTTQFQL